MSGEEEAAELCRQKEIACPFMKDCGWYLDTLFLFYNFFLRVVSH